MNSWFRGFPLCAVFLVGMLGVGLSLASVASAQDDAPAADAAVAGDSADAPQAATMSDAPPVEEAAVESTIAEVNFALVNTILLISAVLVILMQAGFALVEVGLNSSKNTVNILAKNLLDFSLGIVLFFGVGYGLMYPGFEAGKPADGSQEFFKFDSSRLFSIPAWTEGAFLHPQIDFLFQAAFAATAATIVSGAVAGRLKFGAYLVYTAILTAFVYPVSGSWKWGNGWLETLGFHDFAGSGLVHMVGGVAGLAGAMLLGPRIGRYSADGKSIPIPGHNVTFVTLGVFLLLIGWYGFNPGSQFGAPAGPMGYGDVAAYGLIATNTTLAACAGAIVALLLAWGMFGKPDLTMSLNGMLAGLVGITANCDCVTNGASLIIGAVAGALVFFSVVALDKLKIDDPVGAFPVHGVCGAWGLIACALFGGKDMVAQLIGTAAIAVWAFGTMFIVFAILKAVGFFRVSAEEETMGLDVSEHGMHAYPSDGIVGGAVH